MTTSYTVEVERNGQTLYYSRGRELSGEAYRDLPFASTTNDFAELGVWEEYVLNDLNNGSVASYQLVEVELKATAAPGLDNEIKDAVEREALKKLTALERKVLGV